MNSQLIAVGNTNILAANGAEVYHILYLYSRIYKIDVYGCYNQFQWTFVTALYWFIFTKFNKMALLGNASLSENDSKPFNILKMTSQQNGRPPHR